ncbi:MAG: PAS domain-containing protein [bacterium]
MNSLFRRFMKNRDFQTQHQNSSQRSPQEPPGATNFNLEYGDLKQVDEITRIFQSLAKSISPEQQCSYDELSRYTLISLALFDAVSTGIMLVEKNGTVALVNRSAKGWLGYNPEDDLRGWEIDDLLENNHEFIDLILKSLRGESISRKEIRFITRDGKTTTLGATLSPVKSMQDEIEAAVVVFARIPEVDQNCETSSFSNKSYLETAVIDCIKKLERKASELLKENAEQEASWASGLSELLDDLRWIRSCLDAFQVRENRSQGIIEYVDLNSLLIGILNSIGLKGSPRLRISLQGGLPLAPIDHRTIEKGIEYLILGSLEACKDAVAIETHHDPMTNKVSLTLSELGESGDLIGIHCNLDDYLVKKGRYRELGLMLLRSDSRHTVCIKKQNGFYSFSLSILVPKKTRERQKRAV